MSPQEVCGRGQLLPPEGIRGGAAREMWVEGSIFERQEKRGKAPRSDGLARGTGFLRSEGVWSGNGRLRDCRGGG